MPAGLSIIKRHAASLLAIALLVFMVVAMAAPIREESATYDESAFLIAGYSYWHGYDYTLEPENPPLAKMISAAPLLFMDARLPGMWQQVLDRQVEVAVTRRWSGETQLVDNHFPVARDSWYFWPDADAQMLGQEFVYGGANDADKVLAAARWMQVALTVLTGIVIFLWLRQLAGGMAAALGVALWALNPVTLAYGHLVLTDMGETLMFVLAVWCFAMFLDRPSTGRAVLCGLACGGALVMKLSAVLLAPILLVLLALHAMRKRDGRGLGKLVCVMAAVAGGVVWLVYAPFWSPAPPLPADAATMIGVPTWFQVLRPVLIPRDFFKGLALVGGHESSGHWAFLHGQWRRTGWWYYFPVTMAVKTPLPLLLVTIVGLVMWLRGLRQFSFQQAIPWIAALMYLLFAMAGTINIGVRHLLPMFALLAVGTASQFSLRNRQIQVCAWLGTGWLLLATWRAHPYFIEYFNEIAGGPSNGYRWLVDSNLDWGQDVKRLKQFLDKQALTNIDLAYFGPRKSIDYHGIAARRVTPGGADGLRTGTLAISATELMNPAWDWLRASHEPAARVGYTMFIYRLADADTKARWEQMLRINPNDARAHYNLGIIMERAGDAESAIAHYEQAIRIQPGFAMAHYNLAIALQQAGKLADAVEHYEQVLRIEPDNVEGYISLGLALAQTGRGPEAITQYQRALAIAPDSENALNDWGIVLQGSARIKNASEANALLQQAEEKYEQALRIDPGCFEAWNNWGGALLEQAKSQTGAEAETLFRKAGEKCEQALRIEPESAGAHYNLAVALERTGHVSEAIRQYEQALKLKPDLTAARSALVRLRAAQ
jgi:tetratricopeptide (TPR) repeat protein